MTYPVAEPATAPRAPNRPAPAGACDSHVHLLGDDYPLWDGRIEDPAPGTLDDYLRRYSAHLDTLGFSRGVIVHSILYGTDNTVTLEAVRRMGDGFRGVGLLPDDASEADLDAFAEAGVCALRLNYVHGGVLTWQGAKAHAPHLRDRGMHIQMLLHSHLHMEEIAADIPGLGVPLVIDHLGWPDVGAGPEDPGFQTLLRLLSDGLIYLKLSAPYRFSPAPYAETDRFVGAALAANSERCLWGSDWPHIMLADADMPDAAGLLDAFDRACPDDGTRQRVLVDNPRALFGF